MRIAYWRPALLAVAALSLIATACSGPPKSDLRAEYQAGLNSSPARFSASDQVIGVAGRLYTKKDAPATQGCLQLCGTIEPKNSADPLSGYKVSLPIGFRTTTNNPGALADKLITELVYWDPIQHKKVSTRYTYNQSTPIPSGLVAKTIDNGPLYRDMYIQSAYVHPKRLGGWVIDRNIPAWYEPLGSQYGMTATVKVSGSNRGVKVCAPADAILSPTVVDDGIPVTSFSKSC